MTTDDEQADLILVGRSSSHFTRITRWFALELQVPHRFEVVQDLMSRNDRDYAGNPALRLPILIAPEGTWFGSLNICRALSRHAGTPKRIVWPEDLLSCETANALELTLQAMATEVSLIMAGLAGGSSDSKHLTKLRTSLTNSLQWLDQRMPRVVAELPDERELSYLEVALCCLVTHLEFRQVVPVDRYRALRGFCDDLGRAPAGQQTRYRFDPA